MNKNNKDSLSIEEHQLKQVALSHSARNSRRYATVEQTIHENVEFGKKNNSKKSRKLSLDGYLDMIFENLISK